MLAWYVEQLKYARLSRGLHLGTLRSWLSRFQGFYTTGAFVSPISEQSPEKLLEYLGQNSPQKNNCCRSQYSSLPHAGLLGYRMLHRVQNLIMHTVGYTRVLLLQQKDQLSKQQSCKYGSRPRGPIPPGNAGSIFSFLTIPPTARCLAPGVPGGPAPSLAQEAPASQRPAPGSPAAAALLPQSLRQCSFPRQPWHFPAAPPLG